MLKSGMLLCLLLACLPPVLYCEEADEEVEEHVIFDDDDVSYTYNPKLCADGEKTRICVPTDYIKFELPEEDRPTYVSIGVDIKDIPKVNDKDFSITLNAYFIVKWQDRRLIVERRNRTSRNFMPASVIRTTQAPTTTTAPVTLALHEDTSAKLTAVNLQILRNLWLPDVEILNLKAFETHSVLSKLEGIWIDNRHQLMYALATRITFICPMKFNAFPMDIQRCRFQVGSFNYDMSKMVFVNEFVPNEADAIKSILDYEIEINDLRPDQTHYLALGMNYSVAGFEMILHRKISFYVVTYYLPSGLFVVVSWISFLVNPEVIPGRMTLLVTIFLVLINIFNTIQTNSPKAEGLTAIEAWVIACIIFVFGALGEYTVILLKIKLTKLYPRRSSPRSRGHHRGHHNHGHGQNRKASAQTSTALTTSASVPLTTTVSNADGNNCSPPQRQLHGSLSTSTATALGHVQARKDNFAKTDLTFLIVFPLLFLAFNVCYWTSLYWWRYGEQMNHYNS